MKRLNFSLALLCIALIFSQAFGAKPQQKKVVIGGGGQDWTGEAGDFLDIPELAVFVTQQGEELAVTNVMDAESRPKGYEDIDIQLEDLVLMANGKRMKTLADLTKLYKEAKPGTEIKLGIKRGERMSVISFDKADPDKLPKRKMIIREGGGGDFLGLPEVGLFIGTKGEKLVITEVLDDFKGDAKEGDEVLSLNGEKLKAFQDLSKKYEAVKVGETVKLGTSRAGKQLTVSFKKPESKGGMKVIKRTMGN